MLKRGVAILLVLVLAAALGSCGKKEDPPDPAELAAAAKECAENLLSEKYAETGTLKYEVGDVCVSETAAEVQVKIEDKDFVITLTKAEDDSWKGTLPEEITEYLNSLKEENQKAVAMEYAERGDYRVSEFIKRRKSESRCNGICGKAFGRCT